MADSYKSYCIPLNFKHRKKLDTQDNLLHDQTYPGKPEDSIDPCVELIQLEEDYHLKITGYRRNRIFTALSWLFIVLSFGIFGLCCYWSKRLFLFVTHSKCSLMRASKVLIEEQYKDQHKSYHVKNINVLNFRSALKGSESGDIDGWDSHTLTRVKDSGNFKFRVHIGGGSFKKMETVRYFSCRKIRFIWDPDTCTFFKLNGLDSEVYTSYYHQERGLAALEQYLRRAVYGANKIVIKQRSVLTIFLVEILNPFFIFQLFSVILWSLDDYMLYASAIIIMTLTSVILSVSSTYKNQRDLHQRVCSSDVVHVIQGTEQVPVPTEQLVPGDIIVLPTQGCVMYCDAVLLNGSCIANESALTGESDPVMKTSIPNTSQVYDDKEFGRHTLYSGTEILQTRFYGHKPVLAIVVRTGFLTTKGTTLRTLLYPAPADYKFEKHSLMFVGFLACVAVVGFFYTIVSKSLRGISLRDLMLEALDLITVVVPPALPAAKTIGAMHALLRLKRKSIYCTSPRSINVSGSVNCVCFDKTGTLTEEGLNMWGVIPVEKKAFSSPNRAVSTLDQESDLLHAMVTCHTLTLIREKLSGDPMDLKIFESTGWHLEEPVPNDDTKFDLIIPTIVKPAAVPDFSNTLELGKEIGILRHFTFSSSLQRMTVIARTLGASNYDIYCKGAPESICNLCVPDSVPDNFHSILKNYTRKGYRVIAAAFRPLPPSINYTKMQRLSREEVETDLILLGLIVLENKLKPETMPVISKLKDANMRIVIVTGDNLLTAVSVGRDCGIILPEQDVIAIHCVETPLPRIYYTYADVSPITSSINSPVGSKPNPDGANTGETRRTEFPSSAPYPKDTIITFNDPANLLRSPPKNFVFALTGTNWAFLKQHFPELIPYIGIRANIFSRMNPEQKQHLVREMQDLEYVVAMCGDGANDCGALKAAHCGISLNGNESSAASPFTSRTLDIRCVLEVITEGRAALVTSFTLFKFMALYSLTQFITLMILYAIDNNLSDVQFLYIDLFVIAFCAFSLGHTPPYKGKLAPKPPPSSIISVAAITSLLCQTFIICVFQLLAFFLVRQFDFFVPYEMPENESTASYENYAVFSMSALQFIILAIVFHKGPPYVGNICSNYFLIASLFAITASTVFIIVTPMEWRWLLEMMELKLPPDYRFRIMIIVLGLINLILSLAVEIILCDYLLSSVLKHRLHANYRGRKQYASIEQELTTRSDWPMISCDVELGSSESSDKGRNTAYIKRAHTAGSQTIPRRPLQTVNKSMSNSVPNVNNSCNSSSDLKLNCVSSQTTIQSVYFTPTENFSVFHAD